MKALIINKRLTNNLIARRQLTTSPRNRDISYSFSSLLLSKKLSPSCLGLPDVISKPSVTSGYHCQRWKSTKAPGVEASATKLDSSNLSSPLGPSKLECIRSIVSGDLVRPQYLHKVKSQYGTVFQIWVFQTANFVVDPEIFMNILRQEWSYPHGAATETWPFQVYYKYKSPSAMPMMLLQGENWKEPRHTIQTHMFSPKAADIYQDGINNVVQDTMEFIDKQEDSTIIDMNSFLMNVSFEMLAQVLLDRRMGLVSTQSSDNDNNSNLREEIQFVKSAVDSFHALGDLMFLPPSENMTLLRYIPTWNKLEQNMDQVWKIGMKWIEETEQSKSEAAFVNKLADHSDKKNSMNREERLVNLVTLLQAGVDTTSNTLSWTIYQLAKRPHIQEKLRNEIHQFIPPGSDQGFHRDMLSQLPYLKAFLREVQRCSPAASGTIRRLPFDVQVDNYLLEKDTLIFWDQGPYSVDRELLGGDPNEFLPERWLASEYVSKNHDNYKELDPRRSIPIENGLFDNITMAPAPILSHPLMTTAFSVGPRMCVGARIAQNEIHSLVSKICSEYNMILYPSTQDIKPVRKLLMTPDPTPQIKFERINKSYN